MGERTIHGFETDMNACGYKKEVYMFHQGYTRLGLDHEQLVCGLSPVFEYELEEVLGHKYRFEQPIHQYCHLGSYSSFLIYCDHHSLKSREYALVRLSYRQLL